MSSSSDDEGDDFDATGELPGEATRRRSSTQRRTSSLPVVDDATGRGRSGSTLLGQPGPNDVGTQMRRATGRRTGQTLTRVTASVVRAGIAGLGKGALARAARRGSSQVQGGGKGRKTFNYFGSIPSTTLAQVSKGAQVTQETKLKTLKDKLNVQRARRNSLHQQLRDLSVVTEANMEDRERVIAAKNDVIARMRHKNAASRKLMETNKDNHRTKMDWAKSKYDEEVASLREKLKAADEELTLMAELIDTKDTLQVRGGVGAWLPRWWRYCCWRCCCCFATASTSTTAAGLPAVPLPPTSSHAPSPAPSDRPGLREAAARGHPRRRAPADVGADRKGAGRQHPVRDRVEHGRGGARGGDAGRL